MPPLSAMQKTVLIMACLVAIGWACLTIRRSSRMDMDKKAEAMHRQGGIAMARLAVRTVGGSGSLLVLEPAENDLLDSEKKRWMADQLEAFYQRLGSKVLVSAQEKVRLSLSRESKIRGARPGFTLTRYRQLLSRHPHLTAVVSFVGEPLVDASELAALKEKLPPMVCFSHDGSNLPLLMKQGLVAAAIVPRREAVPVEALRGDWFPVLYQEITPETVDAWAAP